MIDLTKPLPDSIIVDGVEYKLKTDFREWIRFGEKLKLNILSFDIFEHDIPPGGDWEDLIKEFYISPEITPSGSGETSKDIAFDYVSDGSYIYASFMQAYGIDLLKTEYMHWHVFKALFDGLPDETKMAKIIGYRLFKPSKKSYDDIMRERKRAWRLPEVGEQAEIEQAREVAEKLYNMGGGQ